MAKKKAVQKVVGNKSTTKKGVSSDNRGLKLIILDSNEQTIASYARLGDVKVDMGNGVIGLFRPG